MADVNAGYGFLFPVSKDRRTEGGPQFTGSVGDMDGRELQVAAWPKTSKKGERYLSIKLQVPEPAEPEDDLSF